MANAPESTEHDSQEPGDPDRTDQSDRVDSGAAPHGAGVDRHPPEVDQDVDDDTETTIYEDSPGAGLMGAIDDLPEPNEPG